VRCPHWRRLTKNIEWAVGKPKYCGGQKVVNSDKCMGISQLLGARARAAPISLRLWWSIVSKAADKLRWTCPVYRGHWFSQEILMMCRLKGWYNSELEKEEIAYKSRRLVQEFYIKNSKLSCACDQSRAAKRLVKCPIWTSTVLESSSVYQ